MGASQPITPKYVIHASFEVEGVVEKSDVIGAIFGQTEGLFGPELDLRELQKSGRLGRIEIDIDVKQGKTNGKITIPSSLDKPTTALIAAAVESVDRVGPCLAKIAIDKMEDAREAKREEIVSRAKSLLQKWTLEATPTTDRVVEEIAEFVRPIEIVSFGPEKLSAGPDMGKSNSIIIVEGRADVANLLKSGFTNVIACEGTRIPETIVKLSREKEITAFLDGDRGGDIILKELLQVADIDYLTRAPPGMEVEELTPKQILKALRSKVPVERGREERPPMKPVVVEEKRYEEKRYAVAEEVAAAISSLRGTLEAVLMNETKETVARIPVSELYETLQKTDGVHTVVFDGVITQRLVDISGEKGIKSLIGERVSEVAKRPVNIQLMRFDEIAPEKQVK